MKSLKWKLGTLVLACLLGLSLVCFSDQAEAKSRHHSVHKANHHTTKGKHRSKSKSTGAVSVRTAQMQLADLGFYTGALDGKNGPMMKRAVKDFQRERGLKVTGKLDAQTSRVLAQASRDIRGDGIRNARGGYGGPSVVDAPVIEGPVTMTTRYGNFDVRVEENDKLRNYTVILNGQTVLTAINQPSDLRLSSTYEVGGEDVIVATVYTGRSGCFFENSLLVVRPDGSSNRFDIPYCAAEHKDHVKDTSLFIEFPNGYDGSNTGVTWRYENGTINPLM